MEPARPESQNHKLLGRSSHCQRKILPTRPMTRKQWKHKTNKALKDLFTTGLSRGTIRQKQITIKPGLIRKSSTGYLLFTDHNAHGYEAYRVLKSLHNVFSFLQHSMQMSFRILDPISLQKSPKLGARHVALLQASDQCSVQWMSWTSSLFLTAHCIKWL